MLLKTPSGEGVSLLWQPQQAAAFDAGSLQCCCDSPLGYADIIPFSLISSWNSWENWTETQRVSFLASLWAPVVLFPILCSLLNVTNMMGLKRVAFCVCLHVCMQQSQLSSLWSAKSTFSRYEQFFLLCEMYRLQCSGRRKRWILSETGCWRTAEALKAFYCLCAVGHGENT